MKKTIPLLGALGLMLVLAGCGVSPDKATSTLGAMGMTNIQIGGYSFFGCSEDDTFRSSFTAIGQNGQPVSGVVCSAWFKGTTVRFN